MEFIRLHQSEYSQAIQILKDSDLPFSDLEKENLSLFAFAGNKGLSGIGGIENFGEFALLRSVAVVKEFRGKGIGGNLILNLESVSRKAGIKKLFLLTTTAKDFFRKEGYKVISRLEVPNVIQKTTEFASLCPVTAVCMVKEV